MAIKTKKQTVYKVNLNLDYSVMIDMTVKMNCDECEDMRFECTETDFETIYYTVQIGRNFLNILLNQLEEKKASFE